MNFFNNTDFKIIQKKSHKYKQQTITFITLNPGPI
jgi:hypothetical protein